MTEEYLTDDEQLEVVKQTFVEYAPWIIGGVLVGAALFFGWRYFQSYTNDRALKAAGEFSAMTAAVEVNDRSRARQIGGELTKDFAGSPYADQAQLTLARLAVDEGRLEQAIPYLTEVMNGSKDSELRQVARLRLARVLTAQGKPDEAIKTLADPMPPAFAATYHDVRGDAYVAAKNIQSALTEYQAALGSGDPSGINTALLELKIQDLGGALPVPNAKPMSADTLNKAKP
jgi:predicted negative regulator of RcsB-dependent stress response